MQPGHTLQPERPKCSAVPFEASRERVQGADIQVIINLTSEPTRKAALQVAKSTA